MFLGCSSLPAGQAVRHRRVVTRVAKTNGGYQLLRAGRAYFVKGAGGIASKAVLAKAGGNSIRTWGADNLEKQLDEAHRLGLSVAVGIWLGHERHGFNYNSADQVAAQYEMARTVILRYRDHPAVLLWGLGNEMEGVAKGDNAAIWSAINNIAAMAKKLDPNHPTMTVLAEIGGNKVKNVHRLCPDIDIVGINSYGGAPSLAGRYRKAGGTKPYILTEFGPPGAWEVKVNAWGAPPEPTSTTKADLYHRAYDKAVTDAEGLCLGSYAFTWGHKQEATATWFGMFLPDGSKLAAVDVMTELWSGKKPANRCPTIRRLALDGADCINPGAMVRAVVDVTDPEQDPVKIQWVLQRDVDKYDTKGDAQVTPQSFPKAIVKASAGQVELRMPKAGGKYRLYVYVRDGRGGAAMANVPLRVRGPEPVPGSPVAKLPLALYGDNLAKLPYDATGWMGDHDAVAMDVRCSVNPHEGKTCLKAEFRKDKGWGGVVWQSPAQDWGDRHGGYNLSGATTLSFWARGETGGEKVKFGFGLIGRDKKFYDTAKGELSKVVLTAGWKRYTIALKGKDLTRIKSGFYWVVAGAGKPVTFYLDDIRYDSGGP